jgi:hypothetical protein
LIFNIEKGKEFLLGVYDLEQINFKRVKVDFDRKGIRNTLKGKAKLITFLIVAIVIKLILAGLIVIL